MRTAEELMERKEAHKKRSCECPYRVCICGGTSCTSQNSRDVREAFREELRLVGMEDQVEIVTTGCHGLCAKGPVMTVYPEGVTYANLLPENLEELVEEHFVNKRVIPKFLYTNVEPAPGRPNFVPLRQSKFVICQTPVVFERCGKIDPENIEDFIEMDGYQGLAKALTQMTPEDVAEAVTESGLRGRGGGAYLTGVKWQIAAAQESDEKYVICNADEGDLGAYMDRSVIEADPHTVIEGLTIAAYAVGASQGYVYIRPEYTTTVKNLTTAISQARENGLLGDDILSSGFSFDMEIRFAAGAYVCGEETAMISSFEWNRGEPRLKPAYPVEKGLYEKPTVINNVETLATVAAIIRNGSGWFAQKGNETACGTKIFALGGDLNNTGLVEVPLGTSLRTIVEEIGGGMVPGKALKAIQTGGASGGYIPASDLDVPLDYDVLAERGTLLGAGGLMALGDDICIIEHVKQQVEFSMKESCGKCTACRIGTQKMYDLLDKITEGKADMEELVKLEELAEYVRTSAYCGLGKAAPNPVLSSLRYFREDYVAHIQDRKCSAKVCKPLITYEVNQKRCEGCGVCAASCPAKCISEREDETKVIDMERCLACDTCYQYCPVKAISKE